jgi:hypothetical protein
MARIPQADFGGTRFQGRAQSRQYNPVTAKSESKKIEEQKRILLREQEIKNRELEREYQMETLELESKQTVESSAQRIALEIEGHALKAQQLYAKQDLQSKQEVEKDIYLQEASVNKFQLKQESDIFDNRLAQERALLENTQQIKRTAFDYNQTNQQQVLEFQQTNARSRLANQSQLSSSQTQLIGNTINTLLSFGGSVLQYSSDMDKLNKVQERKNLNLSYMSNRSKGADLAVLNADEDLNRTELAGEQAIRNVEATEIQRSELRNVNAGGAANRARRATSTRDLGIQLPGLAKDVLAKGGIISGPNGIPIDIKNPQSHSDVNAIALHAARTAFDNNSGGLSNLDSAEAVRSLRQQFDNTVTNISSNLSKKLETKRSGDREFAFQNNFYSQATEGNMPQQQMFNRLKEDYIISGESTSSASKKARETMFNFYNNRNDNDALDIFGGVQQVDGQAGTEMINVMGDQLRDATADTFSDDNTVNKNAFETIEKEMYSRLQDVSNPSERISIMQSAVEQLQSVGLGKQARTILTSIGKLRNPDAALVGDASVGSQISSGEITTEQQIDQLASQGLLTPEGAKKGKELLADRSLANMPKDDISKNSIKAAQKSASDYFLRGVGIRKDPITNDLTIDKMMGDKGFVTAEEAELLASQIEIELLIESNRMLKLNPELLEPGNETKKIQSLREVSKTWIDENLKSVNGKYRVDDLIEKNKTVKGDKGQADWSNEQKNRFKGLLNDPSKFAARQSSLAVRGSMASVDWSGFTRDILKPGAFINGYALRNYRPLRGDILMSQEQFQQAHKAFGEGTVNPTLAAVADALGKSPLSVLNSHASSGLTPRLPLYNPKQLSQSPLGSGTAPISAVEGAQMLMALDFPVRGASWLAGNIQTESTWYGQRKPWDDVGAPAGGLTSWRAGRLDAIEAHFGRGIENISNADQLSYLREELKTFYIPEFGKSAFDVFMNPYATERQLIKASIVFWGYGVEGDRYSQARNIERQLSTQ